MASRDMQNRLHWLLIASIISPLALFAGDVQPPMVISVSHTSPDTRYLRLHADELEMQPFTGTLVTASWPQPELGRVWMGNQAGNLSWAVFKGDLIAPQMLESAAEDMRQAQLRRVKD